MAGECQVWNEDLSFTYFYFNTCTIRHWEGLEVLLVQADEHLGWHREQLPCWWEPMCCAEPGGRAGVVTAKNWPLPSITSQGKVLMLYY